MLSRLAESLFWIGRYVERADDTARIVDVHLQFLLEDPWADEDLTCRSLLAVMGVPVPDDVTADRELVLRSLAWSPEPGSVLGAVSAARENARRAREAVSTDLWEALNTTWNALRVRAKPGSAPHPLFGWVRERTAVVQGLADSTMSRDVTWNFLAAGRSIERADMTARLVASRAVAGTTGPSWQVLLRSCGAHEAYLRAHHGAVGDERAAEFLLLDPSFPRSVVHAIRQAEQCLEVLAGQSGAGSRRLTDDDPRRMLGRARAELEYTRLTDLLADLPQAMARVQQACSRASEATAQRFFPQDAGTTWTSRGFE